MMCDPITGTLLAIQGVSTAASISEQRKAGKATERAYQAEERRAEVQNVRNVRQQIRSARLAQSAMTNRAAQTGGVGSSALAGGTSSVGAQLSGNLSYMGDIAEQNTAIGQATISAARASSNAAIFGQIGQLSGTIFSQTYKPSPNVQAAAPVRDAEVRRVS
jgi:hypothetical protein